ncbi:MAG: hypothetical protein AAGF59_09155 [Pseudomonadota bacterium]
MNLAIGIAGALSSAVLAVGAFAAIDTRDQEVCVLRYPAMAEHRIGYELIDLMRREAWVTLDWTLEDYADFSPGPTALNWMKNDPRSGFAARAKIMRSPECTTDGAFTYQSMFGRTFFHIADISNLGQRHGANGEIREGGVTKYHRLEFDPGQTVSLLVSPRGERFVRVNRPVVAEGTDPVLPEGWLLTDIALENPWRIDLFGKVRVLRLKDGTSYQGPVGMPIETSRYDEPFAVQNGNGGS